MEGEVVGVVPEQPNEFAHLGLDADGREPVEPTEGLPPAEETNAEPTESSEEEKAAEAEKADKSKRFQELILRRKVAEADAAEQRAERERVQQELDALRAPKKEAAGLLPRPSLDQFDTVAEWQAADTAWLDAYTEAQFSKREQVVREKEEKGRQEREFEALASGFDKAEEAYKSGLGDKAAAYEKATENLKLFTRGKPDFVRALLNTSPEVVHAVGEDIELADKLSTADPLTLGLELGRLQARMTDKGRQGRRFSQATAPEPTVGGIRGSATQDFSRLDGDDYAKARRAQIAAAAKK